MKNNIAVEYAENIIRIQGLMELINEDTLDSNVAELITRLLISANQKIILSNTEVAVCADPRTKAIIANLAGQSAEQSYIKCTFESNSEDQQRASDKAAELYDALKAKMPAELHKDFYEFNEAMNDREDTCIKEFYKVGFVNAALMFYEANCAN